VLDPVFPKPSLTNMLLMWLSGARHRVGISGRGNDYALTLPVAPLKDAVHHIDQTAALLAAFGVDLHRISSAAAAAKPAASLPALPSCRPSTGWGIWPSAIYLTPSELTQGGMRWGAGPGKALRLLVNVSAGAPERLWPEECFIALLHHVQARLPVVPLVAGTPADSARMERIARGGAAQAAHTSHYRQMMAIAATSDLVLTGDTSVTHVASAFGKPVLGLFADSSGAIFGPYTGGYSLATPAPTLESLPAKRVIEALDALILQLLSAASPSEPGSLSA
jgi:ADP-heptose:LPS heptosyltransferase